LSCGLTLPPIIFIDAVKEEEKENAYLFKCLIHDERGLLGDSIFGKTDVLEVNSENTYSIRCVYFSMPLMATSDLQCVVNNLVKDVAYCLWQFWKTKFLVGDIYIYIICEVLIRCSGTIILLRKTLIFKQIKEKRKRKRKRKKVCCYFI